MFGLQIARNAVFMVFLNLVNSNETISLLMLNMIYQIPISDADLVQKFECC